MLRVQRIEESISSTWHEHNVFISRNLLLLFIKILSLRQLITLIMPASKVTCSFCGKTNTKWVPKYVSSGLFGLGSTKIGEKEEIDPQSCSFYRCVGCGRIFCNEHYHSLCDKKEVGWWRTKEWVECPKCGSTKIIKL